MQNNESIVTLLLREEVKDFIDRHLDADTNELALKIKKGAYPFSLPAVLELIRLYRKARIKLPRFFECRAALNKKAYEQSSSELTALKKAGLAGGSSLLNLCGGLGVDDWAFSRVFDEVVSLEKDAEIHEMAAYNLNALACRNVERKYVAAEDFLRENSRKFDWVYADPDRRSSGGRSKGLEDASPDITALWPELIRISENRMIKASPLVSIFDVLETLSPVSRVFVIAVSGEVKEVLFISEDGRKGEKTLHTSINMEAGSEVEFSGFPMLMPLSLIQEQGFFYEANPAMIKAGLAAAYAKNFDLKSLIPGASYQFSEQLFAAFQGRKFRIVRVLNYSRKSFTRYLAAQNIKKAHFARRNFSQSVEELRKTHKVAEGGNIYFFFYRDAESHSKVVQAEKI